jgi:hypothetical protein
MRKVALVLIFVFAVTLVLTACSPKLPDLSNPTDDPIVVVSNNWTYIMLDLYGTPGDFTKEIGNAILQWEQANPNRRIVSLQIIYSLHSYSFPAEIRGISIYSEIK